MAIAYDTSQRQGPFTNNSATMSFTATGLNIALVVFMLWNSDPGAMVSHTYGGVALTNFFNNFQSGAFGLFNATAGTANIVITWTNSVQFFMGASSYTGVGVGLDNNLSVATGFGGATLNDTTVNDGAWMVGGGMTFITSTPTVTVGNSRLTGNGVALCDTGIKSPAGAVQLAISMVGGDTYLWGVSLKPYTDPGVSSFRKFRDSGQQERLRRRAPVKSMWDEARRLDERNRHLKAA
jgi:hypothetical protein